MEPKQDKIQKEEIYSCKKCHYPLSSSLSVETAQNNYFDILNISNEGIDPNKHKCIFIVPPEKITNNFCQRLSFDINYEKEQIICRYDKHVVGFITVIDNDKLGIKITFGYLNLKDIEITEVGLRLKKEIPVYSQEQYTVLAKLKQLRYYVKQLTPTLKESMEMIKEEQRNIYVCEDKFEQYKLNLVLKRYKEIQNEQKQEENNQKKDNDN